MSYRDTLDEISRERFDHAMLKAADKMGVALYDGQDPGNLHSCLWTGTLGEYIATNPMDGDELCDFMVQLTTFKWALVGGGASPLFRILALDDF